jgi:inhibitor of KinA
MLPYKVLIAGDTALVIEFGDGVDRQLNSWVLALARRLNEVRLEGITETVPTFRSLRVY